jgi:hypothetical protein
MIVLTVILAALTVATFAALAGVATSSGGTGPPGNHFVLPGPHRSGLPAMPSHIHSVSTRDNVSTRVSARPATHWPGSVTPVVEIDSAPG